MGDVDGVGDFSQELTDGDGFLSADSASGSHGNDQRKDYQDAYGFVDSVHPEVVRVRTSYAGHDQYAGYQEGAPPEAAFNLYVFPDSGNEQAAKEGVEQACETDVQLVGGNAPSSDDRIGRIVSFWEQPERVHVHGERDGEYGKAAYQSSQSDFPQLTDEERVEDVRDVFEH